MKGMETDDLIKSQLKQKADQQRQEIETELHEITDRTEKAITNALVIGGALALTYFLVRGLSSSKKSKTRKTKAKAKAAQDVEGEEEDVVYEESGSSKIFSQIGTAIATQATVVLLDLAKEKLMEYLQAQAQKKADENS
ncbi:MAG: hypothetical protein KF687_00730 [Cyclobacteriaceae bacterium]|nr:hypothetical protein [Cyclobacteriaceae bacterium]